MNLIRNEKIKLFKEFKSLFDKKKNILKINWQKNIKYIVFIILLFWKSYIIYRFINGL